MTQTAGGNLSLRELSLARMLLALAGATALAAFAVLMLLSFSPESGSSPERALEFTAARSGFATAILSVAAFVYAQVENLCWHAPRCARRRGRDGACGVAARKPVAFGNVGPAR